jgi:N-acetyl-gamma-glutamyl-phosphate reductase
VHAAHPNLRGLLREPFVGVADWQALAGEPRVVVFAAQPHGELAKELPALEAQWRAAKLDRLTVIDLSGDHRLTDAAAFERAYGKPHPHPARLGSFVYGFPEWQREKIKRAARIASPGCFATALNLALLPFADRADIDWVAVSAATGSSGSGALPSDTTHHPTRAQDYRAYKPLMHQHLAEAEQLLAAHGSRAKISFVPHSAPLVRGIFLTAQLRVADAAAAAAAVRARYANEPFVRLVEGSPRVAAVAGSNFADLGVAHHGEFLVVMVALDNLLKGMAGQAVQCMNLALGYDETLGLRAAGHHP